LLGGGPYDNQLSNYPNPFSHDQDLIGNLTYCVVITLPTFC